MLRTSHLGLLIALFCCYPIAHAGSAANKCTDGKTITYANIPCEDLGLKPAGAIKDAVTVVPALPKQQGNPPENSGKQHNGKNNVPGNDDSGADVSESEKIKPVNSLIEKLLH